MFIRCKTRVKHGHILNRNQDSIHHGHFVSLEAASLFSCCVLWKEALNCVLLCCESIASAELLQVLSLRVQPPA